MFLLLLSVAFGAVVQDNQVQAPPTNYILDPSFVRMPIDPSIGYAPFPANSSWLSSSLLVMGPLHNPSWSSSQKVCLLQNPQPSSLTQPLNFKANGKPFLLSFDWAAQAGIPTYLSRAILQWNDLEIKDFNYNDYDIHHQSIKVWPTIGENEITFVSVGRKSAFGVAVSNIVLTQVI